MNKRQQRVSVKDTLVMYAHRDFPLLTEAHKAATTWNNALGHNKIQIRIGGDEVFDANKRNGIVGLLQWDRESSIQGITYIYHNASYIQEADIKINLEIYNKYLATSAPIDGESLMLHELGHSLGLDDVDNTGSIMNYYLNNGILRRSLFPIDIENLACEY